MVVKIKNMTNEQLNVYRNKLPKYKNYMTNEQLIEADAIYLEQLKRYKKKVKEYNEAAMKATGLKHGDNVERFQLDAFGMGGESYTGRVLYDRNGRLIIRTKRCDGAGRRTFPLNKGWTKV